MRKLVVIAFLVSILNACSYPAITAKEYSQVANNKASILKGIKPSFFSHLFGFLNPSNSISVSIKSVDEKNYFLPAKGNPFEISIKPGKHIVTLQCSTNKLNPFPNYEVISVYSLNVDIEPGYVYFITARLASMNSCMMAIKKKTKFQSEQENGEAYEVNVNQLI